MQNVEGAMASGYRLVSVAVSRMQCRVSSEMHSVNVIKGAELERVVGQQGRQVVVVMVGRQLVVQARQGITCRVWQPEARIARIATTCRVGGVRRGETCTTNT